MNLKIDAQLDELQVRIENGGYAEEVAATGNWSGADVIINEEMNDEVREWVGDQAPVVSLQVLPAMRRAIITRHARELSWLYLELGAVFYDELDYVSKYDFFGGLAVRALNCIQEKDGKPDCEDLLLAVLDWSRGFRAH